jgi:hypothetical protein
VKHRFILEASQAAVVLGPPAQVGAQYREMLDEAGAAIRSSAYLKKRGTLNQSSRVPALQNLIRATNAETHGCHWVNLAGIGTTNCAGTDELPSGATLLNTIVGSVSGFPDAGTTAISMFPPCPTASTTYTGTR